MPDGNAKTTLKVLDSIGDIAPVAWDACARTANPFVSHAFLRALEESGAASPETGWLPRHLILQREDGTVLAALPLYLKTHSYGEYVFDWGWAEAYERAGGRYYPKLQASIPFTPVTGPRLLLHRDAPPAAAPALAKGLIALGRQSGVSSAHVTFIPPDDQQVLDRADFLTRQGLQYHWSNRGYRSFDDFLVELASRKRKAVRKERGQVAGSDLVIETLTGADLKERHWDAFWRFYLDTVSRKWAHAYLNRAFFFHLGETMADRVVLVLAQTANGRPVAGALNLLGTDTLYGRYWGCDDSFRFLHFEICYYRAIEFAIEHRLVRVEAGAQGEHKVQRGYLPVTTLSAHWIADPAFRRAIHGFLVREEAQVRAAVAALTAHSPYRNTETP
ncbi:MAG: GNAT family N-acetyltransferase [Rhodospirillales bacterium]